MTVIGALSNEYMNRFLKDTKVIPWFLVFISGPYIQLFSLMLYISVVYVRDLVIFLEYMMPPTQ
jgi:hypothetical protein